MAVDIVGRISQRTQLLRWLTAAVDGQPVVIAVDGPPGVGKSTLVDWTIGQAVERGVSHRTVTVPESGDVAAELHLDATTIDEHLSGTAPHLLVVDDAQWLDETGQRQLEHLVFRLGTAALTARPIRFCVVVVVRDDVTSTAIFKRLIDEPITRRLTVGALDDRESRELTRRLSPGISDPRTIARIVELSGGNALTVRALAEAISVGEVIPSPASTTGTIPVEVAWRARLSTLSGQALRAAITVALAEKAVLHRRSEDTDLLAGHDAGIEELEGIGAVRRSAGGVAFTHPLLRTTALDLASPHMVVDVAGGMLDRLESTGSRSISAGILVRLSAAAHRAGTEPHRHLVQRAFDDAISHASWSAAGDLADYMVDTAVDINDRATWLERAGQARFHELDRDEATEKLIEAADAYEQCAAGDSASEGQAGCRNHRAECLLLALRTDFTRSGQRRHPQLDELVAGLVSDSSIEGHWRARAAAILAERAWVTPDHDRRRQLIETAQGLAGDDADALTEFSVHIAAGLDHMTVLELGEATSHFALADKASRNQPDPWWFGTSLSRRGLVTLLVGDPMSAISDTTSAAELATQSSNWAEHGLAVAVRSVASTRLGRFADADNDTESTILSARRADSADPFLASLPTAIWRRAVRGDEAGVAALRDLARQQQMYIPFAEFIATALLDGAEHAAEDVRPRWSAPRNGLSFRNIGFHLAQIEAAVLAGHLETVDQLFPLFDDVYRLGVRASHDWPTSVALAMAAAAVELGDDSSGMWIERSQECAASAGSVLEHAIADVYRSRYVFAGGHGGQTELDQGRAALEALDALGAPLLARLQRARLASVVGQLGMPAGQVRTVMFTDIVDSTRLMSSAGNAAWAVMLGEHHRLVRAVVGRFRGSIMTSTGDGFSAWFTHATEAVEAAHCLHQAIEHAALVVPGGAVRVRVGLASGSVFDLGADASGLAVAEAARVMATAGAGETHAARSVIEHGCPDLMARSLGVRSLKGLPEPVEIFELAGGITAPSP